MEREDWRHCIAVTPARPVLGLKSSIRLPFSPRRRYDGIPRAQVKNAVYFCARRWGRFPTPWLGHSQRLRAKPRKRLRRQLCPATRWVAAADRNHAPIAIQPSAAGMVRKETSFVPVSVSANPQNPIRIVNLLTHTAIAYQDDIVDATHHSIFTHLDGLRIPWATRRVVS